MILFVKYKSKELKIFNILRARELKFGPNLGCRTENSFQIFNKICVESKFIILLKEAV